MTDLLTLSTIMTKSRDPESRALNLDSLFRGNDIIYFHTFVVPHRGMRISMKIDFMYPPFYKEGCIRSKKNRGSVHCSKNRLDAVPVLFMLLTGLNLDKKLRLCKQ